MVQSFSDDSLTHDPDTGVPVERVLHAPAVHFKGKGFYNTDYGTRKRQRETASAEGSSEKKGSSSDGGSASDGDGKAKAEKASTDSGKPKDAKPAVAKG